MKLAGIIETKLQKAYDLPTYPRIAKGFRGGSGTQRGGDLMWEPTFQNVRVAGGTNALRNQIVQCVLITFRPAGMVEILLNENAATMGVAGSKLGGPSGENQYLFPGVSTGGVRLQFAQIYIPEVPGIYSPRYGIKNSATSFTTNGATAGSALVQNSMIAGYTGIDPLGYTPVGGVAGLNFSSIRRWNNNKGGSYRMYPGSSGAGTTTWCTGHDWLTGDNISIVNSARPSYWRWLAGGPADIQVGRTSVFIEDDPTLDAFFAGTNGGNSNYRASWHGGFIFGVYTNFQGPTGQRSEILVTDAALTKYWLLKFVPADGSTIEAMQDTGTPFNAQPWEVAIDKYGILWLYFNVNTVPYANAIYTTFDPIGWDIPQLQYVPRASLSLACMDTCLAITPTF